MKTHTLYSVQHRVIMLTPKSHIISNKLQYQAWDLICWPGDSSSFHKQHTSLFLSLVVSQNLEVRPNC